MAYTVGQKGGFIMPTATLEREKKAEAKVSDAEGIVRERYPSYKVVPLFKRGKVEYFRCTRFGQDANGSGCIIRSCFLEVCDGKILERKD